MCDAQDIVNKELNARRTQTANLMVKTWNCKRLGEEMHAMGKK